MYCGFGERVREREREDGGWYQERSCFRFVRSESNIEECAWV